MTQLASLTETIASITGTDDDTAGMLASTVLGTLEAMRVESGVTTDTGDGYPPEHGPWSVESTAADAWETYRELQGEEYDTSSLAKEDARNAWQHNGG
jgi:hypothetical protein